MSEMTRSMGVERRLGSRCRSPRQPNAGARLPAFRVRCLLGAPPCAVVAFALLAAGPLGGQEPTVRAYVEPATVEVGDTFELVVEVTGATEVEALEHRWRFFRPCRYASPLRPDRTLPFATEIRPPPAGEAPGSVVFSCSSVAWAAGSFVFGPFGVTADGRGLESEAVTLDVTLPDPGAVSVRARLDRSEVQVGDEFKLVVDVTPAHIAPWPDLPPDTWGFAETGSRESRDGSMSFGFVATAPGTHEVGPVVFKVGDDVIRTEPVTLVVVGDPPAIEARAFLNTGQTWVGSDVVLVVEAEAPELDADPVLPDMSAFAEPPRATSSGGGSSRGGRYTVHRDYRIRVVSPGEYEIGSVQVVVGGRTVLTEPLRLVVSEAPPPVPVESPKDLRATATVERQRVYAGEPVIVTYRVLARDNRSGFEGWRVEGDDTLVLPPHDDFQHRRIRPLGRWWERVSLDGRRYRIASEHRVMFSPVEAGETAIRPAELMLQVNQRRERDDYGWEMNRAERQGTWTPVTLTTDPIPIEVVPLPAGGRPASFRGHLGPLAVVSRVDRTHMQIGDTLTLRVEISSVGEDVAPPVPEIRFPTGFEVTDIEGEVVPDAPAVGEGFALTHFYSYRLVARQEGGVRIPPVEVSWFDPETESYGTAGTEPFEITVAGGAREGGG